MSTVKIPLFDSSGKELGSKEVLAQIFDCEVAPSLLHQVVRWQRAKKRAGTHAAKTRSEVRGGGSKPWRQKGLGRARAGSSSSPIWVGGGVAHGPKQRSYDFSINSKERSKALCGALSARVKEGKCLALKSFDLEEIKTQKALEVLAAIGIAKGEKVVVVASDEDLNVGRSLRNAKGVNQLPVSGLNVYDLLNAKYLVLTEKALEGVEARLAK
jgi:large subunit ribosomal protein L4